MKLPLNQLMVPINMLKFKSILRFLITFYLTGLYFLGMNLTGISGHYFNGGVKLISLTI